MRALPEEFDASALSELLADGWGFDVETVEYAPVGGGTYHWVVTDGEGTRGFVNVDDLDRKPWLGATRDAVFEGLTSAFDTAAALRDAGLDFVVAPVRARDGQTVCRAGPRYTTALFPFVDGEPGRFGEYGADERAAVVTMLDDLHQATPTAASVARRIDLELPARHRLEDALQELDQPWTSGPLAEPARQALAVHASHLAELLANAARLSAHVAQRNADWVVTHGEPHAANVMRTTEGYVLVDWDTVALAPPERDLWMLADHAGGAEVDPVAVAFFRLRWDLADIASFTDVLRSPHVRNDDTAKAYNGLLICLTRDR